MGPAKLADLEAGDLAYVQARACKAALRGEEAPTLTARRIVGRPAPAPQEDEAPAGETPAPRP